MRTPNLQPRRVYRELPPWNDFTDSVRKRIVAEAWEAMLTCDIGQISFGQIAKKIGVTTPALHYYFPTHGHLAEELLEGAGVAIRSAMVEATERFRHPRACYKAFLRFAARRPHHFSLMLAPRHRDSERMQQSRRRFFEDFRALLAHETQRDVTDPEVHALWSALLGAATLITAGELTERQAFDSIKPLLDRLRAP